MHVVAQGAPLELRFAFKRVYCHSNCRGKLEKGQASSFCSKTLYVLPFLLITDASQAVILHLCPS